VADFYYTLVLYEKKRVEGMSVNGKKMTRRRGATERGRGREMRRCGD
jgi:hypothetical protein